MTVYTEQVAEVVGKGLPVQTQNLYNGNVRIRNITNKPIKIGNVFIEGEKEVLVNARDPKIKRDLVHYIGEYIINGNNIQNQLEILVGGPTATGLASANGSFKVSETAPASPSIGDVWFDPSDASTQIYYDGYWVQF